MPKKKLVAEIGMNEDGTAVIPKEDIPEIPVVSESKVKAKVKREMSEAQRLNMLKVIEANKIRWAKKREEKEKAEEEAKMKKKADEEALIRAGTHVRVKIAPAKPRKPREKPIQVEESATEEEEEEEEVFQAPPPRVKKAVSVKKSQRAPPPPSTDEETTETETDDDYKAKKREVRREVKKNLKALKAIDEVIESSAGNPYLAYLAQKWK